MVALFVIGFFFGGVAVIVGLLVYAIRNCHEEDD